MTSKCEFARALRHLKMVAADHAVDQVYQVYVVLMAQKDLTVLLVERESKAISVHLDQKEVLDYQDLTVSFDKQIYSKQVD